MIPYKLQLICFDIKEPDETFRLFVDYKKINLITINDTLSLLNMSHTTRRLR
jgi:hypothetical protein